nr:hypothetical protein Iba_chr04fCG11510 [Ipomoea batatas]
MTSVAPHDHANPRPSPSGTRTATAIRSASPLRHAIRTTRVAPPHDHVDPCPSPSGTRTATAIRSASPLRNRVGSVDPSMSLHLTSESGFFGIISCIHSSEAGWMAHTSSLSIRTETNASSPPPFPPGAGPPGCSVGGTTMVRGTYSEIWLEELTLEGLCKEHALSVSVPTDGANDGFNGSGPP